MHWYARPHCALACPWLLPERTGGASPVWGWAQDVFFVDNESAWDPSPSVRQRVHTALAEAHRVLTPQGTLLSISFGQVRQAFQGKLWLSVRAGARLALRSVDAMARTWLLTLSLWLTYA